MHIYKVTGTVTLNRAHPTYQGAVLKLAEPIGESLVGGVANEPDSIVVWDELGADVGSIIAVADGGEAAQPFRATMRSCAPQRCTAKAFSKSRISARST